MKVKRFDSNPIIHLSMSRESGRERQRAVLDSGSIMAF